MSRTVFLTGSNGFLGLHIVQQLLLHKFDVVAVVRAESKGAQITRIASEFPNQKVTIEVVPDMSADHAYDKVLAAHPEVTVVIHSASPVAATLSTIEDFLGPAVNSVVNLLTATKAHAPQVTRFIFTSSMAAVLSLSEEVVEIFPEGKTTVNEKDWNVVEKDELKKADITAYCVSKKLAELALWDFIKNEKPNFTATSINPSFLIGENLDTSVQGEEAALKGSNGFIFGVAAGKFGQVGAKAIAHVRDAAIAHVNAIDNEKAVGQRWLISLPNASHSEIIECAGITQATEEGKNFKAAAYPDNKVTLEQFGRPLTSLKECLKDLVKDMVDRKAF